MNYISIIELSKLIRNAAIFFQNKFRRYIIPILIKYMYYLNNLYNIE